MCLLYCPIPPELQRTIFGRIHHPTGRKRRNSEANADLLHDHHYPYYNFAYNGYPRMLLERKRRDADAEAAPDADISHQSPYGYARYFGHHFG